MITAIVVVLVLWFVVIPFWQGRPPGNGPIPERFEGEGHD